MAVIMHGEDDMITIRKSDDRSHLNHGWLDTYHTFSFGNYHDAEFMGFSALRVINQDRVQGGQGFGTHGHADMEIVSYVLEGVLEHKDSMGNGSQMRPGEVQLLSAGRGVTHSEFNASATESLHFLQMWVIPAQRGTEPRYEQKQFPVAERRGAARLIASPDGEGGSLTIAQDVRLYAAFLDGEEAMRHAVPAGRVAWLHVARGELFLNDERLGPGDGAAIRNETDLVFERGVDSEFVLWELPEAW